MERLNDRIKAMFDMVGENIRSLSNQLLNPDGTVSGTASVTTTSTSTTTASMASLGSNGPNSGTTSAGVPGPSPTSTSTIVNSTKDNSSIKRSTSMQLSRSKSRIRTDPTTTPMMIGPNGKPISNSQRSFVVAKPANGGTNGNGNKETVFAPGLIHAATMGDSQVGGQTGNGGSGGGNDSGLTNCYNCAVYFIHCVRHHRVAVTKPSKKQALWMPFTPIPNNLSWNDAGLGGLLIILSGANMDTFLALKERLPFIDKRLLEVFDIQMPQTLELITRLTWYVKLDSGPSKHFKCCQNSDRLIWIEEKELEKANMDFLWGHELIVFYQRVKNAVNQIPYNNYDEYNLEMAFRYLPRNPHANNEEAMLCSSNLSEKDIERLYSDFLDHCFPSIAMTLHSFKVYMTKYGFDFGDSRLVHMFRAFNFQCNGYVTFPELLMGLACIDVYSVHNETRCKFLMRYFDVQKRGYLTDDDLRRMIVQINPSQAQSEVEEKLHEALQAMEIEPDPTTGHYRITHRAFVAAIGSHRFRGTSKICRAEQPIFAMISNAIFSRMRKRDSRHGQQFANIIEPGYAGTCSGCKLKKPELSETLLRMNRDGYVIDHKQIIFEPEEQIPTSQSSIVNRNRKRSIGSNSKREDSAGSGNLLQQQQPANAGTGNNDEFGMPEARIMIRWVHEFAPKKGNVRRPNGLMNTTNRDRQAFYEIMLVLEKRLLVILSNESRCITVTSPAYVIGDIHGNLEDLLSMEKSLWKRFPVVGANLVFLGDYVDRGRWSIECAAYLFALKVLMPNKVIMLRGNHEVRALQCHYSYRIECLNKYGEEIGPKVWELTNRVFDRLPLCAVIDDVIFCAHGGIPRSVTDLNEFSKLPAEIYDPEHDCKIAWEILWSDPIHHQQFLEMACLLQVDTDQCGGYLFNKKRGTAYVFNEDAVNSFMATNGLTNIIRAHEVPTNGFCFHFDKKCATIFSCSHYCGNNNDCAVVLIESDSIRVIRIDTTNNMPATD